MRVGHLETYELLLELVGDSGQDAVATVLTMLRLALLTVEGAINLAAELGFVGAMPLLPAVKLCWIKREVISEVKASVKIILVITARFKLLEAEVVRALHEEVFV